VVVGNVVSLQPSIGGSGALPEERAKEEVIPSES